VLLAHLKELPDFVVPLFERHQLLLLRAVFPGQYPAKRHRTRLRAAVDVALRGLHDGDAGAGLLVVLDLGGLVATGTVLTALPSVNTPSGYAPGAKSVTPMRVRPVAFVSAVYDSLMWLS
jgi:hypothetical protein